MTTLEQYQAVSERLTDAIAIRAGAEDIASLVEAKVGLWRLLEAMQDYEEGVDDAIVSFLLDPPEGSCDE